MKHATPALFALILAACEPPALHATGERYVLAFEDDTPGAVTAWRAEHRRALSSLTAILSRSGAEFRFGPVREAHLVLRTFDSGAQCGHGGGYYALGAAAVFIDYACAHDDPQLLTVCAHEVGHWLEYRRHGTVHHLCVRRDDAPDCYPGVLGVGVLNPWLPAELDPEGEPLGPTSPTLTEGDLIILNAARE